MAGKITLGVVVLVISSGLTGCGLYTPEKDPFTSDAPGADHSTRQAGYETSIVNHVTCEIGQGLKESERLTLPWLLEQWGTTVTQTITVEDQTGLSPGISTISPLQNVVFPFSTGGNVVSPQSFSLNVGGTASVNALRTETIQYTFRNKDVLKYFVADCVEKVRGVMIDGDLKIREFIYDKAQVAALGNTSLVGEGEFAWQLPPFNTFTEEITFVAAYGGSFTPTWKLARFSANTSSNLLVSERTNTNDLIITLGPLKKRCTTNPPKPDCTPKNSPVQLSDAAMNQHNARVQAAALAVSITGQTH